MNSREEFLKSLKVDNTTKKGNRYTSNVKAREMVKKQGLRNKVISIFMAGFITGVCTTGCYKYFTDSEPQHTTNKTEITMVDQAQNILPEEIFFHNKADYEILQKNIAEYKTLDDIFFKNDAQEKRFTELQKAIADKDKLIENLYLNLVKHKVAKDHKVQNYSDLRIRPFYDEGTAIHSVYNKKTDTRISYEQLGEPVLAAISDIANFQSKRAQEGTTISLIDRFTKFGEYEKHFVPNTPLIADMVISLNEEMTNFGKKVKKDKELKNAKTFDQER